MTDPRVRLRSLPARHARSRPCYQEPDTESDSDNDRPLQNPKPTRSSLRVRKQQDHVGLKETNVSRFTYEQFDADQQAASTPITLPTSNPRRTTRKQRHPKQIRTRGQHKQQRNLLSFKRRKIGHPRPANIKTKSLAITFPSGGCVPPWQTLEYHILVKIFKLAAYPLYSSALQSNPSLSWLSRMSRLCRSFYDAGMSALMFSLPLYPAMIAHSMISLLNSHTNTLALNYQTRVRFLDIEVKELLLRKSGINLEQLLCNTPMLTGLRIFHEADEMIGKVPWADPVWNKEKWSYGNLFDILDEQKIHLKVFEWNGRFQDIYQIIPIAHSKPCLQRLESLTIVNVVFSQKQESQRQLVRDSIITAIDQAKDLSSLTIRNCNIVDAEMMSKLPLNLNSLTIINCLSLTSDALEYFLQQSGSSLTELHLAGNQVMDLGFIAKLKALCPNLEQLHIDLSYLDASSWDDRDPLYDELLPNGSPSWPVKLSSIVIGPLRSLSIEDAEGFYTSLVNSAAHLKFLRTLRLKTLLKDGSWRDRAQLRQKWAPLFDEVFLGKKRSISSSKSNRRSTRIQELEDTSVSESADNPDSHSDSDSHSHSDPDSNADVDIDMEVSTPSSMQTPCNIVEFELSDQRPAREQYAMDDFRDAEQSGDEEYS